MFCVFIEIFPVNCKFRKFHRSKIIFPIKTTYAKVNLLLNAGYCYNNVLTAFIYLKGASDD